jgi:hypothetical protein
VPVRRSHASSSSSSIPRHRRHSIGTKRENSPSAASILVKAAGVPVDRYASESSELLWDIDARWTAQRAVREQHRPGFARLPADAESVRGPR